MPFRSGAQEQDDSDVRTLLVAGGVGLEEAVLAVRACTRLRDGTGRLHPVSSGLLVVTTRHLAFVQRASLLTGGRVRAFALDSVGLLKLGLGAHAALNVATRDKPKAYAFGRFVGGEAERDEMYECVRAQCAAIGGEWGALGPISKASFAHHPGDATPSHTEETDSSLSSAAGPAGNGSLPAPTNGGAPRVGGGSSPLPVLTEEARVASASGAGQAPLSVAARLSACAREPQHAIERSVAAVFEAAGSAVSARPLAAIVLGVVVALACAQGLFFMRFETNSHKLYIPQQSALAAERALLEDKFGAAPEPSILIMRRKDGGDLATAESMLALHALHARLVALVAPLPGGGNATYADVCAKRYVAMMGERVCVVSSPLELWSYSASAVRSDEHVRRTISEAVDEARFDLGGVEPLPGAEEPGLVRVHAMQYLAFYDKGLPAFHDGTQAAFERMLRSLVDGANAEGDQPLHVSYWSSRFNEEEAQGFVQQDSYLMALSLLFIMLYVCITLGGATCDGRRSRLLLGTVSGVCTGLAMVSGFGLASLLGVPLQPISPIVCFTLLGVAADDMIIIVFAYGATDDSQPVAARLRSSLGVAGTMITVTSFTSFCAFLTGASVDFPAYAYFCTPAALCIAMVYFLQMTVFTGCIVLDERRINARRADCLPCIRLRPRRAAPAPVPALVGGASKDAAAVEEGAGDFLHSPRAKPRPVERWLKRHHARTLLRTPVRVLVVLGWISAVGVAVSLIPHLRVGLDMRATLPDHSLMLDFVDDLDQYWAGSSNPAHLLVVQKTNVSDAAQVAAIGAMLDELHSLPFVFSVRTNWLEAYTHYRQCVSGVTGETRQLGSKQDVQRFLEDGGVHKCAAAAQSDSDDAPVDAADAGGADSEEGSAPVEDSAAEASAGRRLRVMRSHAHGGKGAGAPHGGAAHQHQAAAEAAAPSPTPTPATAEQHADSASAAVATAPAATASRPLTTAAAPREASSSASVEAAGTQASAATAAAADIDAAEAEEDEGPALAVAPQHASMSLVSLLQYAISRSISGAAGVASHSDGSVPLVQGGKDFEQDVVLGNTPGLIEVCGVRAGARPGAHAMRAHRSPARCADGTV